MKRMAINRLFTVVILLGSIFIFTTAAFAHTASIEISGANKYKAIRLSPAIYNAATSDLADLLIKDSNGNTIPYFINTGTNRIISNRKFHELTLINSYMMDEKFYFDYKIAAMQNGDATDAVSTPETAATSDVISTSIEFTTNNTNFAKEVVVYGSYDDIHWEYMQNDIIYAIDGKSKLMIEFTQTEKYTHIRLELANNLEKIVFNTAILVYAVEVVENTYFIDSIQPAFSVESKDKSTEIAIEGLKNLRLCDITLHTESMFQRYVNTSYGASKELYNLMLNGTSYSDTTLPLDWYISKDDKFIIMIADGDDRPITIDGISVRYYADEIVFDGSSDDSYNLVFSGDPASTPPQYDIERYKDEILKGAIDRAMIGDITFVAISESSPQDRDYRLVFNIVIIAVTLFLGTLIIIKLRKKPSKS